MQPTCVYICDWLKLVTPKTEGFANSGWTIESKVNHHDIAVLFKTWLRWPGSKSSNIAAHIDLFQKSAHFGSGVPTWLWHREPSSNCTDEPGESPIDGGTYQKIRVSHGECDQQNGDTNETWATHQEKCGSSQQVALCKKAMGHHETIHCLTVRWTSSRVQWWIRVKLML